MNVVFMTLQGIDQFGKSLFPMPHEHLGRRSLSSTNPRHQQRTVSCAVRQGDSLWDQVPPAVTTAHLANVASKPMRVYFSCDF